MPKDKTTQQYRAKAYSKEFKLKLFDFFVALCSEIHNSNVADFVPDRFRPTSNFDRFRPKQISSHFQQISSYF